MAKITNELSFMDGNGIYKITGCMASCEMNRYKVSVPSIRSAIRPKLQYVKLYLFVKTGLFEEREQYLIYDWNSFIADVGGFLGLLLGWSMYSLYQELAAIVGRMKNKIMPKRVKTVK